MALKAIWKQTVIFISGLVLLLSLMPVLAYANDVRIESLEVVAITKPVAGEMPLGNGTVVGHANVDQCLWYEIGEGGNYEEYFDQQGGVSYSKAFVDGHSYALELRVKPEAGYTLAGTTFYYEGTVLDVQKGEGDEAFVWVVFSNAIAPDNTDNGLFIVNAGSLNVRDAKDGNRIGGLGCGDVVKVLAVDGAWSKIANADIEGWVKSEFLLRTYSKETAYSKENGGEPLKYTVTAANSINVRKNILVSSERVGGLKKGDEFYVTGERTNSFGELWYVVDYDGKLAYVKADLVAPKGEKRQSVPSVFDKIIDSIMLNSSGSTTPSTTAKRMIYREGGTISGDSVKDNGDGSYEIVLFPDDGHNLNGVVGPEDVNLSIEDYVVTSVIANADGSKTVRMVKRVTDGAAGQATSDDSTQQTNSGSSNTAGVTPKTGDSIPVLFLSVLLAVSLVVCIGSSVYGRRNS